MEVHEYVSRTEALKDNVGIVVGVRVLDHNKATVAQPEVRSGIQVHADNPVHLCQ